MAAAPACCASVSAYCHARGSCAYSVVEPPSLAALAYAALRDARPHSITATMNRAGLLHSDAWTVPAVERCTTCEPRHWTAWPVTKTAKRMYKTVVRAQRLKRGSLDAALSWQSADRAANEYRAKTMRYHVRCYKSRLMN